MRSFPSSGWAAPLKRRMRELFPAPLPPSSAVIALCLIESETELTATVGPYAFLRLSATMRGLVKLRNLIDS